jgi:parvulin-like peptidyl-prolyl isomerase
VSGLIQLDNAYTIVRLNEHLAAGQTRFVEVRAQLEKELQQTKRNQLRAALDRDLRQKAKVEQF